MLVEIQSRKPAAAPPPPPSAGSGTGVRTPLPPGKPPRGGGGPDRASSLSNQILDARYQVLQKLGEGGMSYVYLAKEISSEATVAIKVLSPRLASDRSSVERLRREAGLAMRLDHPNVCRIMRLGESEDGLIYLVMPFLKGELLSDREVRGGPMDIPLGVALLHQVCAGLHHAHELQIIHRDLKPENIILGTPEFMSPEQIRGKPLDARSDIYALGIVAFEMFTGKLPFQGRNAQEMMIARLRSQPIAIRTLRPDIPDAVEKALTKSLQTNPDDRFATASGMSGRSVR